MKTPIFLCQCLIRLNTFLFHHLQNYIYIYTRLKWHLNRQKEHILAIQPNNFSISIYDNINFKYLFLMTCKMFSYIFVKLTPHQMHFPLYIYIYNSTVIENFTFKYLNFRNKKENINILSKAKWIRCKDHDFTFNCNQYPIAWQISYLLFNFISS